MAGISFFGESDMNKRTGKPGSTYPGWMQTRQLEELEEEASTIDRALERREVPETAISSKRERLRQVKERIDSIRAAKPELQGVEKDKIAKVAAELGGSIAEALFTRSDMMTGKAGAHEELKRMTEPCIPISREMAEIVGMPLKPGRGGNKVTRSEAERIFKIASAALGEHRSIEDLRKP